MRRMIPQNQQEVLKKLSEKTQFLQDVAITEYDVGGYSLVIDSDGISYFTISGNVIALTSDEEYIELTGIPNGLKGSNEYPATNDLGTAGYVFSVKLHDNVWRIYFNEGTAERRVYFSVMLSQVVFEE